jgi:hypothetical protein
MSSHVIALIALPGRGQARRKRPVKHVRDMHTVQKMICPALPEEGEKVVGFDEILKRMRQRLENVGSIPQLPSLPPSASPDASWRRARLSFGLRVRAAQLAAFAAGQLTAI